MSEWYESIPCVRVSGKVCKKRTRRSLYIVKGRAHNRGKEIIKESIISCFP